jgi:hypothetical protein
VENTLAYHNTATITGVKSFIVRAQEEKNSPKIMIVILPKKVLFTWVK